MSLLLGFFSMWTAADISIASNQWSVIREAPLLGSRAESRYAL
jgi:hypothetical protein